MRMKKKHCCNYKGTIQEQSEKHARTCRNQKPYENHE